MGQNANLINELEKMNCETMIVVYDKCGVRKEFMGPKEEVISLVKKIQESQESMKLLTIHHPRAAE
jgi:hypothetical protein